MYPLKRSLIHRWLLPGPDWANFILTPTGLSSISEVNKW